MDFVGPPQRATIQLVSGFGHYEAIIDAVRRARTSVWIASANLKELIVEVRGPTASRLGRFRSVLTIFDELVKRGVEIRILHATLPSRAFRSAFDRRARLVKGGLELRMCARLHLKTVIVDGGFMYLGSANWTGAGLGAKGKGRRNFELGILTEDESLLDQVQGLYDHLWRGGECSGCKLRDVCEAPLDGKA